MKKHKSIFIMTLILIILSLSCHLPGLQVPVDTEEHEIRPPTTENTITAATDESLDLKPTITEELPPTPEPTSPKATDGQIAYIHKGNVWRYFISSQEMIQVTTDGVPGDNSKSYGNLAFSPDGRYLTFSKDSETTIIDFTNNALINISDYGQFFSWTAEGTQFYSVQGDFECPEIDELDNQVLINFDIYKFDLNNLENPTHLANIGGGLNFMLTISNDGKWASIIHCGCYSSCGSENLYYLPTKEIFSPPVDLYPGYISFSPDSNQMVVSNFQLYGYFESPLYLAKIDFTDVTEIFSQTNVEPICAQWSPDGEWIVFIGVILTEDGFEELDRCIQLIKSDGSHQYIVECSGANFLTWSPTGDQLLYSQKADNQREIYIYDLTSNQSTKLPIQADPSFGIDWGRLQ